MQRNTQSEFMGITPTGKKMTIKVIIINYWVDSKKVEKWEVIDMLGMMQQLGAIPSLKGGN